MAWVWQFSMVIFTEQIFSVHLLQTEKDRWKFHGIPSNDTQVRIIDQLTLNSSTKRWSNRRKEVLLALNIALVMNPDVTKEGD